MFPIFMLHGHGPQFGYMGFILNSTPPFLCIYLLYLGTVKLLMMRINRWMKNKHEGKPFIRLQMRGMLESVEELNLSWCPILSFHTIQFNSIQFNTLIT